MAKKKEAPKPIFPLKQEFEDSLTEVLHQAHMLLIMVDTIMKRPESLQGDKIQEMLKERTDALRKAMYGDEA